MSSRPAPRYYPFLDGLRALSILAVLLFHSNSIWLEGGFLGVEVFFVISGFIITTLLRDQWLAGGGVDLRRFWLRRCRRLLPGMVTTVLATAVVVARFYPDDWEQVREDWLAGLSFTSNWLYIISERSYFELAGRPRLFEHLWSLGVEFQYYLLWPFVCLGLFRIGKWPGALCCLGGALAAGLWMAFLYTPGDDPSRVYFGTDTRLGGLLIGSAVAFILPEPRERERRAWAVDSLAWLSMAGLLWLLVDLDEAQPLLYRGGFATVALLTALCIFASALYPRGWVAAALAWVPLRWVGVRAYNIYLWHWPVFGLSQPWVDVPLDGWTLLALRLALIAVLVEVSYRWIDTPIRAGWLEKKYRAWRQAGSVPHQAWTAVGLGCCGVFVVGLSSLPPFGRAATAQVVAMEQARLLGVGMENDVAGIQPLAPLAESGSSVDGVMPDKPPAAAGNAGRPSVATVPQLLCTKEEAALAPSAAPWATIIAWPEDESVALANLFALQKPAAPFLAGALPAAGGEHWAMAGDIRSDGGTEESSCRLPAALPQQPANFQVKTRQTENGSYIFRVYPAEEGRRAVFALGDSVMLGAANVLSHSIGDIDVDAQVGRQWAAGTALLQERKRKDLLGDTVIVHLGNNGPISERQLREMLEILKDTPQVVLINLKVPRPYEAASNALLAEASSLYPNVTVVDWRGPSLMARKAFGHDGLHLTNEGARLYAQLIVQTLCKERS